MTQSFITRAVFFLSAFSAIAAPAEIVYKLSVSDINLAHAELEQGLRRNKVIRHSIVAAAIGTVGVGLFWAFPKINYHWQLDGGQVAVENLDRLAANDKSFKASSYLASLPPKEKLAVFTVAVKDRHDLQAAIAAGKANRSWFSLRAWGTWAGDMGRGIGSMIPMVVAPIMAEPVIDRIKEVFGAQSLKRLVKKLEIEPQFGRLKMAEIYWYPDRFLTNTNNHNQVALCNYAKELQATFGVLSSDDIDEARTRAKAMFIEECNALTKSMGYVVAQMKYMTNHSTKQEMINGVADQLHASTYEFARKIDEQIEAADIDGLFNTAALFESTFVTSMNTIGLFVR